MGVISINGMRAIGHHGVSEQERRVGNEFEINISVNVPATERAMSTDNINDTVNYAEIVDIVKQEMAIPSRLIECVAGRIRDRIIKRWPVRFDDDTPCVTGGSITVSKLAPPIAAQLASVSFTLTW